MDKLNNIIQQRKLQQNVADDVKLTTGYVPKLITLSVKKKSVESLVGWNFSRLKV